MRLLPLARFVALVGLPAGLFAAPIVSAQTADRLGAIQFPNSGAPRAQAPFLRGMKLYWSFEYAAAAQAFREAQHQDPAFALAYVGEALTYTHQVWNQQDMVAARAALMRLAPTAAARAAKAPTSRERLYLALAEALYGDGSKPRRDTLFAAAAAQLLDAHPADDEARTFRALALLGLNQGEREPVAYMQAGSLAEEVLRRNPNHPGAAHFVIHAFDDPVHAPLGLWAARRYAVIAPDAPHALHMTSHIFLAMGMWDDVLDVNRRALSVPGTAPARMPMRGCGHYGEWLHYGHLQAGRIAEATALLRACVANPPVDSLVDGVEGLAGARAAHLADAPATVPTMPASQERGSVEATAYWQYGNGLEAAARQDHPAVRDAIRALTAPITGADPRVQLNRRAFAVELRALIGEATVDDLEPFARELEARPVEFGPPIISKPVRELRAELLLAAGQAAAAQREFERALAATPGRSRSLLGLAQAALAAGDTVIARQAVMQLQRNWHAADADLPERAVLNALVARLAR